MGKKATATARVPVRQVAPQPAGGMVGQRVEIELTGIAHGGIAVGRLDGRVVFVSDAIPGETVVAEVTDDSKASFWRAATVEVVTPSEHRQEHVWDAASLSRPPEARAGGAEFGHIELGHQRELKRQVLADALLRMGGVDSPVTVEPLPSGATRDAVRDAAHDHDGTRWRTRVRLHVDDGGIPGPFAARSHRVIPITGHPLVVPEALDALALDRPVPRAEFSGAQFSGARSLDVIVPSTGDPIVVTDAAAGPQRITERVGDREFHLDARGFWQVHRHAAATLTAAVQQAIDGELFDPAAANLDLFGGVGLLAAAVGDRFGDDVRITSVESDAVATGYAAENLADWAGASAVSARVDRFLNRAERDAGPRERGRMSAATIVLDPPRSGAGKGVVASLAALRPAQVVYVACDPIALARDVKLFAVRGYDLRRICAFDLFPHTHHVEAVATLVRSDAVE